MFKPRVNGEQKVYSSVRGKEEVKIINKLKSITSAMVDRWVPSQMLSPFFSNYLDFCAGTRNSNIYLLLEIDALPGSRDWACRSGLCYQYNFTYWTQFLV